MKLEKEMKDHDFQLLVTGLCFILIPILIAIAAVCNG